MKGQHKNFIKGNRFIYLAMVVSFLVFSCEDLGEMNIDPNRSSPVSFNPNFFLPASQTNYLDATTGYTGAILFQSGWAQILASTSSGGAVYYSNMDKYVPSSNTENYAQGSWNGCYRSATLANQIIVDTEGKAGFENLRAVAKIMVILNMQYITDLYGDCPYSEALLASANITTPSYDRQEDIYVALLNNLEDAINELDGTKPGPSADNMYSGDVAKWRKFGYSLMLRTAMRLSKANLTTARTFVERAATGGVFANSADNAFIMTDFANGYSNRHASALNVQDDFVQVRWSKKLIDYLQATNDPRISVIAEVPPAGAAGNRDVTRSGDNTAGIQQGLPNGYDLSGAASPTDITKEPDFPGATGSGADLELLGNYSRPRAIYRNLSGPVFILTYAQTELLLAEALVRGFNVPGTAAGHYSNAVQGALVGLAPFGASAVIDATTASAYAAANPLDISSTANSLRMINEQYWATSGVFFNFVDAWNNWRRTNIPVLNPVVFVGNFSNGQIPRRQIYPVGEQTLNGKSYDDAIGRLSGGDTWIARTWWDSN